MGVPFYNFLRILADFLLVTPTIKHTSGDAMLIVDGTDGTWYKWYIRKIEKGGEGRI